MKHSEIFMAIIILMMGILVWTNQAENRKLVDAHHKYVRQTELDMADMASRIATLERVEVSVELKQADCIWLATSVEVK